MTLFLWCSVFERLWTNITSYVDRKDDDEEEYFLPCPLSVCFNMLQICYTSISNAVFWEMSMVQFFAIGNHQDFDLESWYIIKRHMLSKLSGFGTNQLPFWNKKYMWTSCLGKKISLDDYLLTNHLQNYLFLIALNIIFHVYWKYPFVRKINYNLSLYWKV